MALVFELYPDEPYNDFYVEDIRVELTQIRHEFNFKLKVYKPALQTVHEITDMRAEEILPGVRVSAGDKADTGRHGVKVVIEAPRRIRVDRGTVYRQRQKERGGNSAP
jgi:hypothetical protein